MLLLSRKSADLPDDHRNRIGRELHTQVANQKLSMADQADTANLEQVITFSALPENV